jgi:long-chain fatty acid transport protein
MHVGMGRWGVGGNAGLLYKPTEKLSLGISYRSPIRFKLQGEYRQRIYFPFNPSKRDAETQIGNIFPDAYRFIFDGQGKEILLGPDLAKMTFETPQDFGGGIAYRAGERWTVAADFAWFNWEKMDSLPVTFEDTALTNRLGNPTFRFGWKNTVRFSGGLMFNPRESWSFRMGYSFDQSPVPDSTFNPLFPDVGDRHSFSAGVSYLVGGWELSYNLEIAATQKRDFSQVTGLFENLPGQYKDTRFSSSAVATYRFDLKKE